MRVKLEDLEQQNFIKVSKGKQLPKEDKGLGDFVVIGAGKKSPYTAPRANYEPTTITISSSGAYAGYVSFHDYPIWASDCTVVKISDNTKIDINYLYLFLLSKQQLIYSFQTGAGQPHVYWKNVKKVELQLPILEEQKAIAQKLDKAQELIELRKSSIKKLDELSKALFVDMFGDPVENPKNFPTKKLKDIIILQRGFDLPKNKRNLDGDIDLYGANGLSGKHDEAKVLHGGIITGRSGTIGKVNYTFKSFWPLNTTLFSKETYKNNIVYLSFMLKFLKLENYANYTSVPTLNRNLIHVIDVYDIPLPLQQKFAKTIEKIEAQKALYEEELKGFENLFASLLSESFA